MKPSDILLETGDYFITRRAPKGFEIYRNEATAAKRVSICGLEGQRGLDWCKREIARREAADAA